MTSSAEKALLTLRWSSDKAKLFRQMTGLSQGEFAEVAGVSQSLISKNERGQPMGLDSMRAVDKFFMEWRSKRIQYMEKEIKFLNEFL